MALIFLVGAMPNDTVLDRTLTWFKNNKFFAVVMVLAVAITAAARVVDSIDNLISKGSKLVSRAPESASSTPAGDKVGASFAKPVLTFGGKGIGPGLFTDPRSIAVDGRGNIYVGEFLGSGRVQRFDSTGRFIAEWRAAKPKEQIFGIAADRRGFVYVATGDSIFTYRSETGEVVRRLGYKARFSSHPEDVKATPDGALVVAWQGDSDDVVSYDVNGRPGRRIRAAISSHNDNDHFITHLAVDGLGNVYLIDHYGASVFKYSPDGTFLSRFGSEGLEPGQFHMLLAIAVDGKGRVYASDSKSIQVFDSDGRFLRRMDTPAWVMGLALDDNGDLFAVSEEKVTKFKISE